MKTGLKLSIPIAIIFLCCAQGLLAQSFVFSVRPEGVGISNSRPLSDSTLKLLDGKPIDKRLAVGGWAVESGVMRKNGGLYTVSVHGGIGESENIGAFFNFGKMVAGDLGRGISLGFHRIPYHINVVKDGVRIDRYTDYNYIFGGVFAKFLAGSANNFDITPKLLFGFRESNYVVKESGAHRYYYDDSVSEKHYGAIFVFSLGIGYTLTTGRK